MKPLSKYEIQFSGLKNGVHGFEWDLEPTFFDEAEMEDIRASAIKAEVGLEKTDRMMILHIRLRGRMQVPCDHCGDDCWISISSHDEVIARFAGETDLSGDEVIFLDNSEYKLDLKQYFYEFALLAMPVKRIHAEGECNPAADSYLVKDDAETEKDPRWEALEKLKNKV